MSIQTSFSTFIALIACNSAMAFAGEILYSADFTDTATVNEFKPLELLNKTDHIKISKGNLILIAGNGSSMDVVMGDSNWTDYQLELVYKIILPHANSGMDVTVRNRQTNSQDDPEGVSIHFKRQHKTGKPIRWIRQYGNRKRDILPDEFGSAFNDEKWHRLVVNLQGRDLWVEIDGEEYYSMEDILDVPMGNIMLNVSSGAQMRISRLVVRSLL